MSELINTGESHTTIRKHLLVTASALALTAYVAATPIANADDDASRPTVWIELGGQLERVDGTGDRFIPPFLQKAPMTGPFAPVSPIEAQTAPRYTYGGEGKLSFSPEDSDWVFSATVRYGRSNGNKHVHYQTVLPSPVLVIGGRPFPRAIPGTLGDFSDTRAAQNESHLLLDFQVGKDVGLGMFGRDSTSTFSTGVRFAQFTSGTDAQIYARTDVQWYNGAAAPNYFPRAKFHNYTAIAHIERSFHGLGPSLSWNASAPVLGDADSAEVMFDWGINGALLFGRQKVNGHHQTTNRYFRQALYNRPGYPGAIVQSHYNLVYAHPYNPARARSVVVPDLGAFAGMSLKFPNAKVSFGYRADMFFGAMDSGIDAHHSQNMSFHGPFASISVGLGG